MKKWNVFSVCKYFIGFLFVFATIAFQSCKRKQIKNVIIQEEIIDETPQITHNQFYEPEINKLQYNWFSTRMNILVENINPSKEILSINAFLVNRKDSLLFITLSKMGIEGARLVLTPDSIKYVNHLNKEYYFSNYLIINNFIGFNVDFYTIQSLFFGEDLSDFENTCQKDNTDNMIQYWANPRKNKRTNWLIEQKIQTDTLKNMRYHYIRDIKTLTNIELMFDDYTLIEQQSCFQTINIFLHSANIHLKCVLKGIKMDVPGPTTIRLPAKYKPLELN